MLDDDKQLGDQYPRCSRRPTHLTLNYFAAGLAAGAAAFLSLAGVLFAGFTSFLTSALAGVLATGAGVAGTLAGSAANAVSANADTMVAIIAFILSFLLE